jgi:nucleolar protein 56
MLNNPYAIQSGTAVGKNADAIKKAQAAIAADLEGDDDEDDDGDAKEDEVAEVSLSIVITA